MEDEQYFRSDYDHHPTLVAEDDQEANHLNTQNQHSGPTCIQFQGVWVLPAIVPNIISFQKHFIALDDHIVACPGKAGTTWLKALVFTVVNRARYPLLSDSPLNSATPHQLVPYFELTLFNEDHGIIPDLATVPSPRLFATHLPYAALAQSIKQSHARIVYVTRNPLDVIVSFWHFERSKPEHADWPLEEWFEMFCRGEEMFGPFWDHVVGYPKKVLFLRYEDMKKDPMLQIKRIAEFLGFPFSMEEVRAGVIEEIAEFCSFSNLKNLEVNNNGRLLPSAPENKYPFRKGEVGDHVNYLSPSQIERFGKILEEKLSGSGLAF